MSVRNGWMKEERVKREVELDGERACAGKAGRESRERKGILAIGEGLACICARNGEMGRERERERGREREREGERGRGREREGERGREREREGERARARAREGEGRPFWMPNNGFQARESVEEEAFTNCTPVTIAGSVGGVRVGVVVRDFVVPLASEEEGGRRKGGRRKGGREGGREKEGREGGMEGGREEEGRR